MATDTSVYSQIMNNKELRDLSLKHLADGTVCGEEGKELKTAFVRIYGAAAAEGLDRRDFKLLGENAAEAIRTSEAAGTGDDIETVILRACLGRLKAIEAELRTLAKKIQAATTAAEQITSKADGTTRTDGNLTENQQASLQSINAIQQEDMIQMQVLVQRRGEAAEMLSNVLKAFASTRKAIVGNING